MTWLHKCPERGLTELNTMSCDWCDAMCPTFRQQQILDFIWNHWVEHAAPPTQRDIQDHFGFSSGNSVAEQIAALKRKRVLENTPKLYPVGLKERIREALAP